MKFSHYIPVQDQNPSSRMRAFAIAAIVLLSFIYMSAATAATITVTETVDEIDPSYATDCNPGSESDCSLREAIELSNENGEDDTISIPAGTYTISLGNITGGDEDLNQTGDFDFGEEGQSVIFDGEDPATTIIDANDTDRVFHGDSGSIGDVTFQDITITNGYLYDEAGAAVYMFIPSPQTATFSNVIVSDNEVDEQNAGGVYVYGGGVLVIEDSVFTGNVQDNASGGGGALYAAAGENTVTNSYFYNNSAVDSGAIAIESPILIENSVFYQNTASSEGGAIHAYRETGDMNIVNSQFIENDASTGGAINIRSNGGGGAQHSTLSIYHSTFYANDGNGGALYLRGDSDDTDSVTVNVQNSIFEDNGSDTCTVLGSLDTINSGDYNIEDTDVCSLNESNDATTTDALVDSGDPEDNGGDFITLGLQASSPAIDHVPAAACVDHESSSLTDDVRGYTRPDNTDCEAGAYEVDTSDPSITIASNNDATNILECAVDIWSDPGATLIDNFRADTAATASGSVTEGTPGSYTITYTGSDYDDNAAATVQRSVTVEDTTAPDINSDLSETVEVEANSTDSVLEDAVPALTAPDFCDDSVDITTNITEVVNTSTLGEYTVTVTAVDDADNKDDAIFTVEVVDTTAPVITLSGESAVTLTVGDSYTDAGATATDSFEGDVSEDIVVTGSVDTDTAGTYTVAYNVSDSFGNAAEEVTRTVTVIAAEDVEPENDPETGEGDGTDDTEETLGEVTSRERLTGGRVQVNYENGESKVFQLFSISGKPKVQLHTNGAILIAVNKTYMRTFNAFTGEQLDQVKLFKKKQYKTKFKRFNIYKKVPGKNNVMVLAQTKQKHKKQFKLRSFVVKNGGAITKRPYRTIQLNNNAKFSNLSIAKNSKNGKKARVLVKKKGKTLKNWKYRVTKKKGILKLAS